MPVMCRGKPRSMSKVFVLFSVAVSVTNALRLQRADRSSATAGFVPDRCVNVQHVTDPKDFDGDSATMTPDVCHQFCLSHGAVFFGIRNGLSCWCGQNYQEYHGAGPGICDVPCPGDRSKMCGGRDSTSVWVMGPGPCDPSTPQPVVTTPQPAASSATDDRVTQRVASEPESSLSVEKEPEVVGVAKTVGEPPAGRDAATDRETIAEEHASTSPAPSTDWETVVETSGTAVVTDEGEAHFNYLFSRCPVVRYTRDGRVHSIYVRKSPITINAYKVFTETWSSGGNEINHDFDIYDSISDVEAEANKWNFCNYDDPDVAYPRDCGKTGAVANEWFSMPGGRHSTQASGKFDIYTGSTCPSDATPWTLVVDVDRETIITDVGESMFNQLFRECPVVRYVRDGIVHSIYVRLGRETVNAYQVFTGTWSSDHNRINEDFAMYSNLIEAQAGQERWTFCNYDDSDVGYPRDCGRNAAVPNEWFSMPGGRFTMGYRGSFDVYTGRGCPAGAEFDESFEVEGTLSYAREH